jgi:hypothetical protein
MFTIETSDQKCISRAGLIDEERNNLDVGLSDNWTGWRAELDELMMECFDIPREDLWHYEAF